jgi:hypothetical protein
MEKKSFDFWINESYIKSDSISSTLTVYMSAFHSDALVLRSVDNIRIE